MRIEFDDGTLLLRDASEGVPFAEWDDRVDEYRTQAYRYRALLDWAGAWDDAREHRAGDPEQRTLQQGFDQSIEDAARAYPEFVLTPALHIEPRDYQQAALDAWISHGRQGSVILPTGSGKTFLGLQAIADAGVSALIVTPTIDLMNQWHATLTNAFGDQLTEPIGVLGGGSHDVTAITVTTYDSAYRYINEYGDRFGLLVVDIVACRGSSKLLGFFFVVLQFVVGHLDDDWLVFVGSQVLGDGVTECVLKDDIAEVLEEEFGSLFIVVSTWRCGEP